MKQCLLQEYVRMHLHASTRYIEGTQAARLGPDRLHDSLHTEHAYRPFDTTLLP